VDTILQQEYHGGLVSPVLGQAESRVTILERGVHAYSRVITQKCGAGTDGPFFPLNKTRQKLEP
jgi:hypothetical protein